MHFNSKINNIQQNRIEHHIKKTDGNQFLDLLSHPQLLSNIEELIPLHRDRCFPPLETLSLFLAQTMNADSSCQNAVNELTVQRINNGLAPYSTNTGSYCKARQRLPLEMLSSATCLTGRFLTEITPEQWCWQERAVRLIDGTTVTLPDTPENQIVYPQQKAQKQGLGFPICRIVGIICLASGAILNAAMGSYKGKGAGEQTLLRGMLDTFETGDVVLGDALFSDYFLLAELMARGVDGVFEQLGARKNTTDFRKGRKLGSKDHLIIYEKPKKKPEWMTQAYYLAAPETLTIRELKVGKKILVTTILSPAEATGQSLKKLYKSRWHIELDLRNIKTTLGMEVLSCKTPEMAEKEMWTYLLAYNLIRIVMAEAASWADLLPRQLSFKHTLQLWRACLRESFSLNDGEKVQHLLCAIAQNIVGNRPGRIEPRAVKRRPKPFSLLMQPRDQARAEIMKNGHPKKQK